MRSFIAVALGLLLLISAAVAQGNDNIARITVNEETTGMLITGANIAQMDDLDANLMGNNIFANQVVGLMIEDGNLIGQSNGKTNAIQVADLMLNDTGNANDDSQSVGLAQVENDLTIGNITQITMLEADDIGNENSIDQTAHASTGTFFGLPGPNSLTNSELRQTSVLDACVNGNSNNAIQETNQFITDDILTSSNLYEQASINANILGNENNLGIGGQGVFQIADNNLLTNSWANQAICLDEQITGNSNDISQLARPYFFANLLTTSTALQSIDMKTEVLGSGNIIDQNADLISESNSAVGGHIVQTTDIETNS